MYLLLYHWQLCPDKLSLLYGHAGFQITVHADFMNLIKTIIKIILLYTAVNTETKNTVTQYRKIK